MSAAIKSAEAFTSFVQRHLQMGYNRAAKIIEEREKQGMVSRANHAGEREILLLQSGEMQIE
ncbi:MAG: DNA translocase FtsK [Rhodospirillaceae bacterium]